MENVAQHIPIKALKQKVFQRIEKAIKKDFTSPYIKGSLKYQFEYTENDNTGKYNCDVFGANRYIGKGFVWGTERGYFEIHFNKIKRQIEEIYFVA